jgi:hypothetical protein
VTETPTNNPDEAGSRRWPLIAGVLVAIGALVVALVLFTGGDDDTESAATTDVATSSPVTEPAAATTDAPIDTSTPDTIIPDTTIPGTTTPPTTAPTSTDETIPDDVAARTAIWPWVDTPTRFADPIEAVTSFATDYLGFTDLVVGEYQAGDSRSGEVEIRTGAAQLSTTVFVRQLTADDSWWVLGAAAESIAIDEPEQGAVVESPLTISGSASAFEGTVDVELRADDNGEPIYVGFVTGGGAPSRAPFSDTIEFTSPGAGGGALVLFSRSSEDGRVLEASALRIFYG